MSENCWNNIINNLKKKKKKVSVKSNLTDVLETISLPDVITKYATSTNSEHRPLFSAPVGNPGLWTDPQVPGGEAFL